MSNKKVKEDEDMDQGFILPGFDSAEDFSKEALKRTVESIRSFHYLPSVGPEWEALKTNPAFNRLMKKNRLKILNTLSSILQHSKISANEFRRRDADEKFDFLVEANDDILERIGSSLDEASGLFKKAEALVVNPSSSAMRPPGTWNKCKGEKESSTSQIVEKEENVEMTDLTSDSKTNDDVNLRDIKKAQYKLKQTDKPQLRFNQKIDNSSSPFIPKLKEKPNSLKPLSILPEYNMRNEEFYGHPYQFELDRWEPSESVLLKVTPKEPRDLKATPFIFIDTLPQLQKLIGELRGVQEIAVDLEHHSFRSFLGFTCLIQLSTRSKDYIIDGLELREDLHLLNEIFTNPKLIKVFHGASSDIEWLQKDFGLYVVGLFDTYLAGRALGFNQLSLAFLLKQYCGVSSNKKYQRADWRIRPIPHEMLSYAQMDTHYLLYIYDCLKNKLIEAGNESENVLCSVFSEGRIQCQKRFEKPTNNPTLALRKIKRALNNRQQSAYIEIFKWRDGLAREKDESLGFILPNHMLLQIALTLPKELSGVLACCHPVPFFVQTNLGFIHRLVQKARSLPLHEEKLFNDAKSDKPKKERAWVVMMNSIHDVTPDELGFDIKLHDYEEEKLPEVKKPIAKLSKQWPQPFKQVPDWERIKLSTGTHFKLNTHCSSPDNSLYQNSVINPFDRYKLSNQILGLLKDPEKGKSLDLNDPMIKTVYETIFKPSVDNEENIVEVEPSKMKKENSEMKQEFIPFNPMAERKPTKSGRKKKGKRKHAEEWVESFANPGPNEDQFPISSEEEVDAIVEFNDLEKRKKIPKFLPIENGRPAKNKNKHLEKLKRIGRKRKDEKEVEEKEEGEVEDEEENPHEVGSSRQGPPSKRSRSDPKNEKPRKKEVKEKGKNKGQKGFFNFRSRDGKSMTFK